MATMTVSLPDLMKDWIEELTQNGEYSSSSDYVRDLIRRDKERRNQELSIDELRQIIFDAKQSGISEKSVSDIFEKAKNIVQTRGKI